MTFKLMGAVLIILGCGCFGFLIAAGYRRDERYLRELVQALEYMASELQYRLTPLREVMLQVSEQTSGTLSAVFTALASELEGQIAPNAEACMRSALEKTNGVPVLTGNMLRLLGKFLGKFDLQGQLSGIELVRIECKRNLTVLANDQISRLRSYRTLGVCAGIAIAILLI